MSIELQEARQDLPNVISSYWQDRSVEDRKMIDSVDELWNFIESLRKRPSAELLNGNAGEERNFYFRGQSDIHHGFTSSLYREARQAVESATMAPADSLEKVTEASLSAAENAMIEKARAQGLGRRMSAIQLVALMQHHLMPTRLIDVSRDPFEALFFAVEKNFDEDAVLFVVMPRQRTEPEQERWGGAEDARGVGRDESAETTLPWQGRARGQTQSDSAWTNRVVPIDLPSLDPRMQAQSGVFLSGGLLRNYSGVYYDDKRPGASGKTGLRGGINSEMSNLAIFWTKQFKESSNSEFGATGWVIVVPARFKRELLKRLDKLEGISADSMYPPVGEVSRLLKNVARETFRHTINP